MDVGQDDTQQLIQKYKQRIEKEFGSAAAASSSPQASSREYTEFKEELYPARYSFYEKACNFSAKVFNLRPDPVKAQLMQQNLNSCHLNTTPTGVLSFAVLAGLAVMVFGSLFLFALPLLLGSDPLLFLIAFSFIGGILLIPALNSAPTFMANSWRMKASGQMVQSIFYMVTYMRHTSNLERAIEFASDHLDPPLSLDFRKILWDVETEQFSTIQDSANAYLELWKDWDAEFVEAFHLVEASLYEASEDRRLSLLDKALDVILNGTYENMLHYAHNLKSPMTMLHMLGIILPILGLVILPLVASFLSGSSPLITVMYISLIYNVSLPIGVFYLGRTILSKRPAGYGASDIGEKENFRHLRNVNLSLSKNVKIGLNPFIFSVIIFAVCMFIGFLPLILHSLGAADFPLDGKDGNLKMLEYVCPPEAGGTCTDQQKVGPYGIGASILSLVVVLGLGLSIGTYYSLRSKNVIKIREKTRALEEEFSSALFQLGNRLGDGIPAEIAFAKVAQTMQGTTSGEFFSVAEQNITKLGMGLEQSLFDQNVGAVVTFPSNVIESSMKVLIESIKKGPRIAAQALLSMSRYIKEIHHVEERLKDLMEEVITSMKAQIQFLTPAIAGIVIGITSMISAILTRLSSQLATLASQGEQTSSLGDMLTIFGIGIPTFYFQIVVGIYIVQIVFILTVLSNGIENGADKLSERFELGRNLTKSTLLYCFLAGLVMLAFNLFAVKILSGVTIGG